jgi:hypothetical protein
MIQLVQPRRLHNLRPRDETIRKPQIVQNASAVKISRDLMMEKNLNVFNSIELKAFPVGTFGQGYEAGIQADPSHS